MEVGISDIERAIKKISLEIKAEYPIVNQDFKEDLIYKCFQ